MCNLYSLTKDQAAIVSLVKAMWDRTGNMPLMPGIFPDYPAPKHQREWEVRYWTKEFDISEAELKQLVAKHGSSVERR